MAKRRANVMALTEGGEVQAAKAKSTPKRRPSYGVDEPYTIIALLLIGFMLVDGGFIAQFFRNSIGAAAALASLLAGFVAGFVFIAFAIATYLGIRSWKPMELKRLTEMTPWGGDEVVLDIGCGRGLFSNIVAGKLSNGEVVALDLWRKRDVSGNSPQSLLENVRLAGANGKVSPVRADSNFLPFRDEVFDTVVSGLALHRMTTRSSMPAAIGEMERVLKEGGRVALLIAGQDTSYAELLRKERMRDVVASYFRLGLLPSAYSITARKPFDAGIVTGN